MARRTKIVATIGPASSDPEVLRAMIDAGMDMARVSLSHASLDDALVLVDRIRAVAAETDQHVGILADLPGPKVRAAEFVDGEVRIVERSRVVLETAGPDIAIDHPGAGASLELGDRVVLGDGAIELVVVEVDGDSAIAEVMTGGTTQGRPGVSVPSSRVALSSPTEDDLELLAALCDAKVDMVAISFVRSAADIDRARVVSGDDGPMLVAKIETPEAVEAVEEIVATADAVMVARGDLGIRCAFEDVPHFQKKVIHAGVAYGRPVITATQMLESMVHSPVPTRAEVTDVTNAVFDGTSAVMLSGETAIGRHPVTVISTMSRIAQRADDEFDSYRWGRAIGQEQTNEAHGAPVAKRITAALSAATWRAAMDAQVDAIIACTETGATPRSISRFRPTAPLIAATPSVRVARQLSTAWGITPMLVERRATSDDVVWFAIEAAVKHGYVRPGDLVAVLVGAPGDPEPASDTLRLVRVH
jgi:pyruvate kinase